MQKEHISLTDAEAHAERMMEEFERSIETPSPEAEALAQVFLADVNKMAPEMENCLEAMFFKDH